jgi:hypothetical protein
LPSRRAWIRAPSPPVPHAVTTSAGRGTSTQAAHVASAASAGRPVELDAGCHASPRILGALHVPVGMTKTGTISTQSPLQQTRRWGAGRARSRVRACTWADRPVRLPRRGRLGVKWSVDATAERSGFDVRRHGRPLSTDKRAPAPLARGPR